GLLHGTMPPTDTTGVLLATVLSVMDEQVRTGGEAVPGRPCAGQGKPRHPEGWLVVGEIGKRALSRRNAVAHGRTRVADQRGSDLKLAHRKVAAWDFMEEQLAG